ncbi:hypothetical protein J6A64_07410 [bacterium]|nr:hypothetical protein [bacterium]MBO5446775.1 hypothetical protein [bacterium]
MPKYKITSYETTNERGLDMEFKFEDTTLIEHETNAFNEINSYLILSTNEAVKKAEMENVIQIIDETGIEVNYTSDKFVEIFDQEGLTGFII